MSTGHPAGRNADDLIAFTDGAKRNAADSGIEAERHRPLLGCDDAFLRVDIAINCSLPFGNVEPEIISLGEILGRGDPTCGEHTIAIKKIICRIEKLHWTVCLAARLDWNACLPQITAVGEHVRVSGCILQATCQTAEVR